MQKFTITTRAAASDPALSILDLAGVLDVNTVGDLETGFEQLWREKRHKVILNFEKLTYVSSAGIWLLLDRAQDIRKKRGDLMLVGLRPDIYKLFDLLELPMLFYILETEQEAVTAFGTGNFRTDRP